MGVTIYISEIAATSMPFNRSYIKDVAGSAKLYVYVPYISNSNSSIRRLDTLLFTQQIPKSVYDQALINIPLGAFGEFETTESVQLPSATAVHNEIVKIPQLAGLVSLSDSLAQLATNVLANGYLITFENNEMFVGNDTIGIRTITASGSAQEGDSIIEIDASTGPVTLTLLSSITNVLGIKRIDKTSNLVKVVVTASGTIDGNDDIILDPIQSTDPDVYVQLYYSLTDSEYKLIA